MDDIVIESLIFGLMCGALLFLLTAAIDSDSLRVWTHCLTSVVLIVPSHYVYGPPAVHALIITVVLINVTVAALDLFERRGLDALENAREHARTNPKVFCLGAAANPTAAPRPVNTVPELQACFA